MTNPITAEIRSIRQRLAARFDNDLARIVTDLQRQQRESNRVIVDRSRLASKSEPDPTTHSGK